MNTPFCYEFIRVLWIMIQLKWIKFSSYHWNRKKIRWFNHWNQDVEAFNQHRGPTVKTRINSRAAKYDETPHHKAFEWPSMNLIYKTHQHILLICIRLLEHHSLCSVDHNLLLMAGLVASPRLKAYSFLALIRSIGRFSYGHTTFFTKIDILGNLKTNGWPKRWIFFHKIFYSFEH